MNQNTNESIEVVSKAAFTALLTQLNCKTKLVKPMSKNSKNLLGHWVHIDSVMNIAKSYILNYSEYSEQDLLDRIQDLLIMLRKDFKNGMPNPMHLLGTMSGCKNRSKMELIVNSKGKEQYVSHKPYMMTHGTEFYLCQECFIPYFELGIRNVQVQMSKGIKNKLSLEVYATMSGLVQFKYALLGQETHPDISLKKLQEYISNITAISSFYNKIKLNKFISSYSGMDFNEYTVTDYSEIAKNFKKESVHSLRGKSFKLARKVMEVNGLTLNYFSISVDEIFTRRNNDLSLIARDLFDLDGQINQFITDWKNEY